MKLEEKYHASEHVIMRLHERLGITPSKEAAEAFFDYQLPSMHELIKGNEQDKNDGKMHLANDVYEFIVSLTTQTIITFLDHSDDVLSDKLKIPIKREHVQQNEALMNKVKTIEDELNQLYMKSKTTVSNEAELENIFKEIDELEIKMQVINDERRFNNYRFEQYTKHIQEFKFYQTIGTKNNSI